ncbi:hypothetical protein [Natrarchaeobius chitinivorans]|uniref:Uncharacterized protein n=1 Tax=Natrarchaeobius chitinivorans TaxID=1679083 RepID=A0A3N6MHL8_NATCH|nr:hypothetical protein [Natrarchaeobius chitinivorans]RQG95111.1 hypothetical protein EA473_09170 [Natrarchaeobius chitinivorans]
MESGQRSGLDRFRQPEYTGENRCVPCTAVNVVIAVVIAGAVGFLYFPAGLVVLAVSVVAIYLRGYLVPGTPTLTKRYFPDWLLATFDKTPDPGGGALEGDAGDPSRTAGPTDDRAKEDHDGEPAIDPLDPETTFLDHGVIAPCGDVSSPGDDRPEDDLCLTEPFRTAWRREMDARRGGDRETQVGAFLEVEPELVTSERAGDPGSVEIRIDGELTGRWESDAALVADLAGAAALEDRLPGWDRLRVERRSQLVNGLRTFLDRCPTCGETVTLGEERVESCCRSRAVYVISCDGCDARLIEVPR